MDQDGSSGPTRTVPLRNLRPKSARFPHFLKAMPRRFGPYLQTDWRRPRLGPAFRMEGLGCTHREASGSPLPSPPSPGIECLTSACRPAARQDTWLGLMQQQGELVVNELSRNRSQRLQRNLKLMNIEATVLTGPGESLGRRLGPTFDRVLVDVPCSGTGRVWHGDPRTLERMEHAGGQEIGEAATDAAAFRNRSPQTRRHAGVFNLFSSERRKRVGVGKNPQRCHGRMDQAVHARTSRSGH